MTSVEVDDGAIDDGVAARSAGGRGDFAAGTGGLGFDSGTSALGKDSIQFASDSVGLNLYEVKRYECRSPSQRKTYRSLMSRSGFTSSAGAAGSIIAGVWDRDGGGLASTLLPLPVAFFC